MSNRMAGWITGALVLATTAAGAWTLSRVAPGQRLPVHFGLDGRPNGWAPASVALFISPAMGALMWVLRAVLPKITPRGANLERSSGAYATIWITLGIILALVQGAVVAAALGYRVEAPGVLAGLLGAAFMVIGNVLPKLRWNYVVGIRTPWTLADERVWDKTHRFGGWVMVLGGAVLVAGALVAPHTPKPGLLAGVVGLIITLPVARSYVIWRRQHGSSPAGG